MAYSVYSLTDVQTVVYHPDVGTANVHQLGAGKVTVSYAGDLSSHTTTVDGYVVVNCLRSTNGTITIEVPQNAELDAFFRRWIGWSRISKNASRIALGTVTITDNVSGFKTTCTGVSLQKVPDRTWDRTATNVTYTLLAATITEQ